MPEVLSPAQLAKNATQRYQQKDYLGAAELFTQAALGYQTQGNDLLAAEMANNQSVALLQADDPAGALQAVGDTAMIFAAANDHLREAMAYGNRAGALDALDQLVEAEESYLQSSDLFKELGETEMRAEVLKALSALQLRSGRQLEAMATMQASIEGIKAPSLKQRLLKKLLKVPNKLLDR